MSCKSTYKSNKVFLNTKSREREQLDLTMVVLKGPKKKIPHWVLKGRNANSKGRGVQVMDKWRRTKCQKQTLALLWTCPPAWG